MLIWMRDSSFAGIFKFIFLGLMLMAVGGLVFMDIGGFFRGTMSSNTVVKGGGVNIGIMEFDKTLRRALSAQGIPPAEAMKLGLVDQILNSEIQNRLFTTQARSFGLEVGDESVKRQISKLAEPLAAGGATKKEALQQILRTQGISESEFVGSIRQEMANTLLRAALSPPANLSSPLMAIDLYRYDNEKRSTKIIVFKNSAITDAKPATEEQLKKYYETNKQDFLIPESRTITMATLKTEMLTKNVKISDEQLKADYDKNIASFTKPQRRKVEQALFNTEDEAKAGLEQVKAGKAMKDSVTQDYDEAGLLPDVAGPVFSAQKGAIVGPIKTSLGWHVIKVKDILAEEVIPFAQVKDKLRKEMQSIAVTEELYNAGNVIEDRVAGGEPLENLVKEYGMTTEIFGPFRQNGYNKDSKDLFASYADDRTKIIQAAYDYEEKEIAPVIETADGQFHLVRIDQVIPDTYKPYDSVKADLQKRWIGEQQRLSAQAKAEKSFKEIEDGKKLEDVAKENGGTVQSIATVSRQSEPPAPLTAVSAAQIFAADKGKGFSGEIRDGYIVGVVESITLPESTVKPDAKALSDLEDLTGRSLSQDILSEYVAGLTKNKKIQINQKRLQEVYSTPQEQ